MIIKKFEEVVQKYRNRVAIKEQGREITYLRLDSMANRIGRAITDLCSRAVVPGENLVVSLLFGHGADMVIACIGTLKANKIYVPLDISCPKNRLIYMLQHSESHLVLTNRENLHLAESLAKPLNITILNIETLANEIPGESWKRKEEGSQPAYIRYTSGSTGKPKGVVQIHANVLYYTEQWTRRFSITSGDKMTLLTAFSHDGAVQDMWGALLNGATLYPMDVKNHLTLNQLADILIKEEVTLWHSTPTLYRYFVNQLMGNQTFPHLRFIILGGEPLREHDINAARKYFPTSILANVYGQTEVSVCSIWFISPGDSFTNGFQKLAEKTSFGSNPDGFTDSEAPSLTGRGYHPLFTNKVIIGEPLEGMEVMVIDEEGEEIADLGIGEVVIASKHLALGYWKDEEKTREVFTIDPGIGRVYWTGDLGRLDANGDIEIIGRKDMQIKIRGYRVEIGEIETVLLQYQGIKEAVVIVKENNDAEKYLVAFLVPETTLDLHRLKAYMKDELPDYMIPSHFEILTEMPLTPNRKIDKKVLFEREITLTQGYTAPGTETEKWLTALWSELLGIEEAGLSIDASFFDLGGHSLKANTMIARVHKKQNVKLSLTEVFKFSTIRELASVITGKAQEQFHSITPVEKKEFYALSSPQKRYYVLQQMKTNDTSYNIVSVQEINGKLEKEKFETIFGLLLQRHESLRTAFEIVHGEPVQRIDEQATVTFQYYEATAEEIDTVIMEFIKPFDLSRPPLFRAGFIKVQQQKHILIVDMHHIISDGFSMSIFVHEFATLYAGKKLPLLRLQYKDFTVWQNRRLVSEEIGKQEAYWLQRFQNLPPILNLPTDFPRSSSSSASFEGDNISFKIDEILTRQIIKLVAETGTTLNILLLAAYNILLKRYTGQEDIVVGSLTTGRNHVDLQPIIGLFINTLAIRNFPTDDKTFGQFLEEVKKNTLEAYENQDYQFNDLVWKLGIQGGNLFNTLFTMQNITSLSGGENLDLLIKPVDFFRKVTKYDLYFDAVESTNTIGIVMKYSTQLYQRATIENVLKHFLEILQQVTDSREIKIEDINISLDLSEITANVFLEEQDDFGI